MSDDEMASVTGKNAYFHYAHPEYKRRNRCVARRKSSVRTLSLTPSSETSEIEEGRLSHTLFLAFYLIRVVFPGYLPFWTISDSGSWKMARKHIPDLAMDREMRPLMRTD